MVMPRSARLDIPNVLHHVIARGIEGREIFRDHKDRIVFLDRLAEILAEGDTKLYAWALMPNHFHLLLRPIQDSLSTMMRRLLTGHAVWYNKRHARQGHLFQNRYKSIIVEEDPYFLELLRYIHLNPVRADLLTTPIQLDRNSYTGHAVIMGKRTYESQDVDWVLSWFDRRVGPARQKYRAFVIAGFRQGVRDQFRGGGLIRSAGGREQLAGLSKDERELGDERILGSGTFVEEILKHRVRRKIRRDVSVEKILSDVCRKSGIPKNQLLSKVRVRRISAARRDFFLRAHREAGASYSALGRLCGMAHTSVKGAIDKADQEQE